ncbi:MAG: DUF1883 domain-containing protein [Ignavibacteriales bacterium]|nr:DUF1883 domain-containing protein [Ignavibacteriales bacterium]
MKFLHSDFWIGPSDAVVVTLDGQANVMLLDDANYSAYRCGRSFHYYGGWATKSPVKLVPPSQGHWNVIIDLGGYAGTLRAGVRVIQRELANT